MGETMQDSTREHRRARRDSPRPRHRPTCVWTATWALVLTLLWLAPPGTPASAHSAPTTSTSLSTSTCRAAVPNLRTGLCHRFPDGRITWLGTLGAPGGRIFFCLDKNLESRLPAHAPILSTRGLRNQFGQPIRPDEVAALNHLIGTWGTQPSPVTAAAISLVIREVMGDTGGQFPAGLRVHRQVRDVRGGLPAGVLARARTLWTQASAQRGPWRLQVSGSTAPLPFGAARTFAVSVWSAAGRRVTAPVPLSLGNARGPSRVISSSAGPVRVTLQARAPGAVTLAAAVRGPAADGQLFAPASRRVQRGWIARRAEVRVRLRLSTPGQRTMTRVATRTSTRTATVDTPLRDTVQVVGLPAQTTVRVTARLYGPFASVPGPTACTKDRLVGSVSFDVRGPGPHVSPPVTPRAAGHHTWVISVPGTARTLPSTHPCGLASETTTVVPRSVQVSTLASTPLAGVGDLVTDTVTLTGLGATGEPTPVRIGWQLLGPVLPGAGGCADATWSGAPVLASGELSTARNGVLTTPPVRVQSAGCHTYTETVVGSARVAALRHPPGLASQTVLVRERPELATRVSAQRAVVGAVLTDEVTVRGLGATVSTTLTWRLHGPLTPRNGSCRGLDWATAPVVQQATLSVVGSGVHRTPATRPLVVAGCYSFSESLAASVLSQAAEHPAGHPAQTTLTERSRPRIRTRVSTRISDVGARLRDRILVSGLSGTSTVRVEWELRGPLAPVRDRCPRRGWRHVRVHDRGVVVLGNGGRTTRRSAVLRRAGCYSYSEQIRGTSAVWAVAHRAGQPAQTALVRTPRRPRVPTGP